jgi:D-lyxose ketol-isomerase
MSNETINIEDKKKKLTEHEAKDFLGIGLSTLRRIRSQGLIDCFRYNRKIFHSIEQLEAYQNRHEIKGIASKNRGRGNLRLA